MIWFNYYQDAIGKAEVAGTVTLSQFIQAIKNPKPHIRHLMDEIRRAAAAGDEKRKGELKTHLYSFTPCVQVKKKRRYSDITAFTGLGVLDFDKMPDTDYAIEFKHHLFTAHDFIAAAWISPSKKGVKALFKIPVCQCIDEFKSYYWSLEQRIMSLYTHYDNTPQNAVLPLFISYDPDILYRRMVTVWDIPYTPPVLPPRPAVYKTTDNAATALQRTEKMIRSITNYGHPVVRAAAYALGGYVGSGYLEESTAIDFINRLIDTHPYLQKKSKIYKSTAFTMIQQGQLNPLSYVR